MTRLKMFRQCVNLVHENLLFRQSLRGVTEKKYNGNGTGALMAGMRLMGIKTSLKRSLMQEDWNAMIQTAEDGLAMNPWDPVPNAELGLALKAVGFAEAAAWSLERAVKGDRENKDYWSKLGKVYEQLSRRDDALRCFKQVLNLDPWDGNARSMIVRVSATPTADLTEEILSAEQVVEREPLPADPCDTELAELRELFRSAKDYAMRHPDDRAAIHAYAAAKRQLLQREIEVYAAVIQQEPGNTRAKFNLGSCYMQQKLHELAVPLFEESRRHPEYKCLSLVNLGKCLISQKRLAAALQMFELASLEVDMRLEETRLEINYFIDRLRRDLGDDGPDGGAGMLVPR